jgi:hypothetical protein
VALLFFGNELYYSKCPHEKHSTEVLSLKYAAYRMEYLYIKDKLNIH